ncbi:Type A flavoprotein FprA [Candidatus Methanoperedenaceae archaeon GB37]|nr:Type A flavoprotein FprA [Candidatus Methanoperedenaceae archaeon GB37]
MPKVAIVYSSGMGRTKKMAEAVAEGVQTVEGVDLVLQSRNEFNIDDVKDADAIALGGGTYSGSLTHAMDTLLQVLKETDLKAKVGAAFGSYGWSGEGVPMLIDHLKEMGLNVIEPGIKAKQTPDREALEACFMLGRALAEGVKG